MDSETLERIKRDMEANRFDDRADKALTVIPLNDGLDLAAEVERLRAKFDALIQVCETIQPFISQKYIVSELRAAVKIARGNPSPDSRSYADKVENENS